MDKIDFLKEWYYKEEERREGLNNSLNIQISLLTALLAAIYYLINKFNYLQEEKCLKLTFIVFAVVSLICWVMSIIFLILSYNNFFKGFEYKGFRNANFLNKEEEDLTEYFNKYKESLSKNTTVESLLKKNIETTLIECIDKNLNNNDSKSAYLHNSKCWLIYSVVGLFFNSIFFSINYYKHEKVEIHKVEITNTNYMSGKDQNQGSQAPPPPPRQEARIIKENKQPNIPSKKPSEQKSK